VEPGQIVVGQSFKNVSKQLDSWDRINKSSWIIAHEKGKKSSQLKAKPLNLF
jgi:hypothetical protein